MMMAWTDKTTEAITKASQRLESASVASLRKIVAASADGMVIVDRGGTILFVNPAVEQLFGYTETELLGHPFGFPMVAGETTEIDIVRKGGEHRVAEMRAVSLDWDGQPAFLASLRDITSRKHTENQLAQYRIHLEKMVRERTRALRNTNDQLQGEIRERVVAEQRTFEEKERLQVTLDSIADAVLVTDQSGCIRNLNPVAQTLLDMTEAQALGQPVEYILHFVDETSRRKLPNPVLMCLKQGKTYTIADNAALISSTGVECAIQDSAAPIRDREGRIIGAVLVFRDVTVSRQIEKTIQYQAAHDTLTDLVNRREFERRLAHALEGHQKFGALHTVCYLDLDQFKVVNDTVGHLAGDELLRQVSGILSQLVRERDTLARLGGDEFGLLLDNCSVNKAEQIADNIIAHLRDFRFEWEGRAFQIGVSIGIAPLTNEAVDSTQLLTRADVACYAAKEQGRNRFHVYALDSDESTRHHNELLRAAELREALDQNRFRLWLQPIVALNEGGDQPKLCEVLLRLVEEDGGLRNPHSFIPAAERYNVMRDIDRWVVAHVLTNFKKISGEHKDCVVTINLSGNSLGDSDLLPFLQDMFSQTAVPASKVCFEITETAAIQNLAQAHNLIKTLRESGCRFALDDFGSGLSSFSYLKRLPIDYLKISGNFVLGMLHDTLDHAFVEAINNIGHTMQVQIIAEHVEHDGLVDKLRELGVDYIQGYAVGRPKQLELDTAPGE